MQKLLYVHRHVFALIWTHNTTYVPSWIILFSCILPFGMRPHSFFFLPLPPENKLPLSFPVQNRNITGLFACPPPQTHAHTKDTHADTHWCAFPADMDVFCLPVSHKGGKKRIEGGSERRSVEERGGKVAWEGLICTDGWSEHMLFSVLLFAWETVITVKKETGKGFFLWVAVV